MCQNDSRKLLKDFKGEVLMYSRANVEIKRAVFVGIHTLVTHGVLDKCTEKRSSLTFRFCFTLFAFC